MTAFELAPPTHRSLVEFNFDQLALDRCHFPRIAYDHLLRQIISCLQLDRGRPMRNGKGHLSCRAQLLARTGSYSRAVEDLDRYLALSTAPDGQPDVSQAFNLHSECVAALANSQR